MITSTNDLCERLNDNAELLDADAYDHSAALEREAAEALARQEAVIAGLEAENARLRHPCPECDGSGRTDFRDHSHRCGSCGGSGSTLPAVRDERAMIVAWLRATGSAIVGDCGYDEAQRTAFTVAADAIERGDHIPASQGEGG